MIEEINVIVIIVNVSLRFQLSKRRIMKQKHNKLSLVKFRVSAYF